MLQIAQILFLQYSGYILCSCPSSPWHHRSRHSIVVRFVAFFLCIFNKHTCIHCFVKQKRENREREREREKKKKERKKQNAAAERAHTLLFRTHSHMHNEAHVHTITPIVTEKQKEDHEAHLSSQYNAVLSYAFTNFGILNLLDLVPSTVTF